MMNLVQSYNPNKITNNYIKTAKYPLFLNGAYFRYLFKIKSQLI